MADLGQLKQELETAKKNRAAAEQNLIQAKRQSDKKLENNYWKTFAKYEREVRAIEKEIAEVGAIDTAVHHGINLFNWLKSRKSSSSSGSRSGGSSGSSESSSSSKFFSTSVSPFFVFILALANYAFHWYNGYQINFATLGLDVFTFLVFYFSFNSWTLAIIPFLLQTIIPGLLLMMPWLAMVAFVFSTVISIFLILPFWLIFAFLYELKLNPNTASVKWAAFGFIVLAFFFLGPSFLTAVQTNDFIINQNVINDVEEKLASFYSNSKETLLTQYGISMCTLGGTSTTECKKRFIKEEDISSLKIIVNPENTRFKTDIVQFIEEGYQLTSNSIQTRISAINQVQTPVILNFGCGLIEKGQGIAVPKSLEVKQGQLLAQNSLISCTKLNNSKRGTPTFYFNMTANNLMSLGSKQILVLNKDTRNTVINKYINTFEGGISDPIIYENKILELSKLFGPSIQQRRNNLNPVVGNDLIQPIIKDTSLISVTSPTPLVYGVEKGEKISIGLFLRNTGKGLPKISNIHFKLPQDMKFEEPEGECGITKAYLDSLNSKFTKANKDTKVADCTIIFDGEVYPNEINPRTIEVEVTYGYTITQTKTVTVS